MRVLLTGPHASYSRLAILTLFLEQPIDTLQTRQETGVKAGDRTPGSERRGEMERFRRGQRAMLAVVVTLASFALAAAPAA